MIDNDPRSKSSKAYYERQRAAGMVRVSAWIPAKERSAFWAMYDKMWAQWEAEGKLDKKAAAGVKR